MSDDTLGIWIMVVIFFSIVGGASADGMAADKPKPYKVAWFLFWWLLFPMIAMSGLLRILRDTLETQRKDPP